MANVATLGAKATFDVADFQFGISKVIKGLNAIKDNASTSSNSIANVGQTALKTGTDLVAAFATGATGALTAVGAFKAVDVAMNAVYSTGQKLADGLKWGASLAIQTEKAQIGFEVMLKSGYLAKQMMRDIEAFSLATPFEQGGVTQQLILLKGMGIATEELLPTLRTLGDLSLGDMDKLEGLALAFGQVTAKGKLMSQEFNQLAERRINLRQDLANNLGIGVSEVAKAMEDGKISAVTFRNALIDLAERDFAGMMEKQSKSIGGLLDKLKENTGLIFKDIATQMGEAFGAKDILSSLNDTLTSIRQTVKESLGMLREAREIGQFMRDFGHHAGADLSALGTVSQRNFNAAYPLTSSLMGAAGRYFGGKAKDYGGTLRDRYDAKQNGYGMMEGAYIYGEAGGGMKKGEPPNTAFSSLGKSIGNGIKSALLDGTDFLQGLTAWGFGMARSAGGYINSLKVPENREYRPTGALVAGSSEAYSAQIRNMFGDKKTTIEEKQLEELKRISASMSKMAAGALKDGFKGLATIESFIAGAGGTK